MGISLLLEVGVVSRHFVSLPYHASAILAANSRETLLPSAREMGLQIQKGVDSFLVKNRISTGPIGKEAGLAVRVQQLAASLGGYLEDERKTNYPRPKDPRM